LESDGARAALIRFARTHPNSDVQRKAIETLAEQGPPDSVRVILDELAGGSADPDVARKAVEALGNLGDARSLERVAAFARRHAHPDVQRKAIETYAEHARSEAAVRLLTGILGGDASEDVYRKVLQSLEELENGAGIPALIEAARSHPSREVRARALRLLAESDDPRAQQLLDQTLRRP
jgi:HEAT repeat protein